jgi:hypothetical protein
MIASITTLSKNTHCNDTQNSSYSAQRHFISCVGLLIVAMLSDFMLTVAVLSVVMLRILQASVKYAECQNAVCVVYAERHLAEWHFAE